MMIKTKKTKYLNKF